MKQYNVVFEVYSENGKQEKSVIVEAGNKKLAILRAMSMISKEFADDYKNVKTIEEVCA